METKRYAISKGLASLLVVLQEWRLVSVSGPVLRGLTLTGLFTRSGLRSLIQTSQHNADTMTTDNNSASDVLKSDVTVRYRSKLLAL